MTSALINVPAKAKRGDIVEIKTLMSHIMETGYRRTATGEVLPRDIITSFSCRYNGVEVFRRRSVFRRSRPNPFITFFTVATESGKFEFEWMATRVSAKPLRPRLRSNEIGSHDNRRDVADRGRLAPSGERDSARRAAKRLSAS